MKKVPLKSSKKETVLSWTYTILCISLWIALIVSGLNIVAYYLYAICEYGFFNSETLDYAVMIVIGSYLCLIIDKDKIDKLFRIKKDLPFIQNSEKKKQE